MSLKCAVRTSSKLRFDGSGVARDTRIFPSNFLRGNIFYHIASSTDRAIETDIDPRSHKTVGSNLGSVANVNRRDN